MQPDSIQLLPGTQILRAYEADRVSVRLLSRPYFGVNSSDWPMVEVGAGSITFSRDERGGGIVMLGRQPLALPFSIELDEGGYARQPLDLAISYNRTREEATLAIGQQIYRLAADVSRNAVEVVISSGAGKPWEIDVLEVEPAGGAEARASGLITSNDSPERVRATSENAVADKHSDRARRLDHAIALFRSGRDADALSMVSQAEPTEVSVVWDLVVISHQLRDQGNFATARRVAQIALGRLDAMPSNGQSAKSRAQTKLQIAGLHNFILGDPVKANEAYQAAVGLDPGQEHAADQLKRLAPIVKEKKGGK